MCSFILSGSRSETNNSGCRSGKKFRIRPDPDRQHCFLPSVSTLPPAPEHFNISSFLRTGLFRSGGVDIYNFSSLCLANYLILFYKKYSILLPRKNFLFFGRHLLRVQTETKVRLIYEQNEC